jgi:signal transduction protein with GAF and PtsI domain
MTSQTFDMSSMEWPNASAKSGVAVCEPVDERTVQTVRQHYQTDHQEEFLRLKAQVESLLSELKTLAVHNHAADESELAL